MATKTDKNDDLLPAGATFGGADDGTAEGPIRINLSDAEYETEGRTFEPIPAGRYHVAIYEIKLERVSKGDNVGKPMWNIQLRILDGPQEKRVLFARVMLWGGAAYGLTQLLKATDLWTGDKEIQVPPADDLIGKDIDISVVRQLDKYAMNPDNGYTPDQGKLYKNEVKSFLKHAEVAASQQSSGGSLMP
jgi:hypothetical protein